MKKFWITLAILTLTASLVACTPSTPPATEQPTDTTPPTTEQPADTTEPPTDTAPPATEPPTDITSPNSTEEGTMATDRLMPADAAMYRGTVTAIEGNEGGNLVTLEQAKGRDFGASSMQFLFDPDTTLSFDVEKLVVGAFVEVFYGVAPEQKINYAEVQKVIAANLYPSAEMVIFNGTLMSVNVNPEREGQGQLVMEDMETSQEVVFNYSNEGTQFYMNMDDLKAGVKLHIFHKGIFTMSLPPQGVPLEVGIFDEPA